jgi:hypothetical protein
MYQLGQSDSTKERRRAGNLSNALAGRPGGVLCCSPTIARRFNAGSGRQNRAKSDRTKDWIERLDNASCLSLRVKLVLFLLLATPALLFADSLSDVRATLQKLQSDQLLRARVEIKSRRSGGESGKQKQSESVSTVIVENGPDGLKLSWSPEQIRQSRKAAWDEVTNPDAPRSDLATLKALEPAQALNLLDAADGLRRALEKAELREDKRENYQGKSTRVLVFRIELGLDEEERKALKSNDNYLKLWLDSDGVPLAMERDVQAKFSKFFIGYRIHDHDTRTYQHAAGRLVVGHSTHDTSGAGLGHTEEAHTVTTVTLLP